MFGSRRARSQVLLCQGASSFRLRRNDRFHGRFRARRKRCLLRVSAICVGGGSESGEGGEGEGEEWAQRGSESSSAAGCFIVVPTIAFKPLFQTVGVGRRGSGGGDVVCDLLMYYFQRLSFARPRRLKQKQAMSRPPREKHVFPRTEDCVLCAALGCKATETTTFPRATAGIDYPRTDGAFERDGIRSTAAPWEIFPWERVGGVTPDSPRDHYVGQHRVERI